MSKIITCNRCDVTDLHWVEEDGKYRLFDSEDEVHSCDNKDKEKSLKDRVLALCADGNHGEVHKIVEAFIMDEDPTYFDDRYEPHQFESNGEKEF
jgi:hypothetical protein